MIYDAAKEFVARVYFLCLSWNKDFLFFLLYILYVVESFFPPVEELSVGPYICFEASHYCFDALHLL